MAITATISPSPASRVWRGRCGRRSRSIHGRRARCPPPKARSAADISVLRPRPPAASSNSRERGITMPVYTVHAPTPGGTDLRATDKFVFVRDGFHFWAMVFGPFWLLWNRLWLALIGWIVFVAAFDAGLSRLGVGRGAIFFANIIVALL